MHTLETLDTVAEGLAPKVLFDQVERIVGQVIDDQKYQCRPRILKEENMNSILRRLAITVLAAFAATFATFAASPTATQSWVSNYVSTVSAGSSSSAKVAPVSASITVDGTNYTYSFTMYFANESTWKISESTVAGMAAGTHFAFDAYGNACNYTNAACDTIYQSVSTNWTFVTKSWTTNGTPVFVTNRRDVVQLDFTVKHERTTDID